jgi:hypothetical protein
MGLDCFWVRRGHKVTFDPPLNLVGRVFSGHGKGSFRGQIYANFIKSVSGTRRSSSASLKM